jgi:hypothetical protein
MQCAVSLKPVQKSISARRTSSIPVGLRLTSKDAQQNTPSGAFSRTAPCIQNRFAAAHTKGIVHPLNEELGPHTGLTGVIVTYELSLAN